MATENRKEKKSTFKKWLIRGGLFTAGVGIGAYVFSDSFRGKTNSAVKSGVNYVGGKFSHSNKTATTTTESSSRPQQQQGNNGNFRHNGGNNNNNKNY